MNFLQAAKCFQDALNYIDSTTEPTNFDLFNGLLALAQGLQGLETQIAQIQQQLGAR